MDRITLRKDFRCRSPLPDSDNAEASPPALTNLLPRFCPGEPVTEPITHCSRNHV